MKFEKLSRLFYIILIFIVLSPSAFSATIKDCIERFQAGKLNEGIEKCIDVISSSQEFSDELAKVYVLNALANILANSKDAGEKCSSLYDLLEGYKEPGKENKGLDFALPIIGYLSGQGNEKKLDESLANAGNDWKATGMLAKFIINLKKNADDKTLTAIMNEYFTCLSGYATDNWATAFYPRIKDWHKWILSGTGEKNKLENLVAAVNIEERKKFKDPERNERYAMISRIIELYTQNKLPEARNAAQESIKELKSTNDATAVPFVTVLEILSGEEIPQLQEIFAATSSNTYLWSLGCVSCLVKYVSAKEKPPKMIFISCFDNFNKNCSIGEKNPEVEKWKPRMKLWGKWCESDFAKMDGLEPLFMENSRNVRKPASTMEPKATDEATVAVSADNSALVQQFTEITEDDYKTLRDDKYKKRPKPSGLIFDEEKVKSYINSLPEDSKKIELDRFNKINKIREYLVRILERNPYPKGLNLKSGMASGTVTMANENKIVLRSGAKKKGKVKGYAWSELYLEQFEAFLTYYAQQKMDRIGGEVTKEEGMKNAAQDYLLLAVLYDWYGRYKEALKYGRKAVSLDPTIESPTAEMLLK